MNKAMVPTAEEEEAIMAEDVLTDIETDKERVGQRRKATPSLLSLFFALIIHKSTCFPPGAKEPRGGGHNGQRHRGRHQD